MLKEKDAVEKLKLLTAGIIGNFSFNIFKSGGKGPVNPLLGETLSGSMEDGSNIYLEQISMNPFSTLIHIIGPQK